MTAVTIKGLEELRAKLTAFSDRRFESAIAEALNRSGRQIADEWGKQLSAKLDRPTVLTQRAAILTKRANVGTLSTIVAMRDSIPNDGIPPSEYLLTHELGTGDRSLQKFERSLVASGAMPPGHKAVPGKYAAGRRLQRGVMAPVPERAIAVREAAPALRAGRPAPALTAPGREAWPRRNTAPHAVCAERMDST